MRRKPYREGDEPVPGYRLHEYLGQGGFGEVWKAVGPGGVHLALKVIHNLDRKKGGKELRALRLLKNIRHPNLVPLTGFWLKTADGELLDDEARAEVPSGYRGDAPRDDRLSATMTATDELAATALGPISTPWRSPISNSEPARCRLRVNASAMCSRQSSTARSNSPGWPPASAK